MIDEMNSFLRIPNYHIESCGDPPVISGGDENVYIGYFENQFGEQWVFTYDRRTKVAHLRGGDVEWDKLFTVEDGMVPDLILDSEESAWPMACWHAATGTCLNAATSL